MQSIINFIKYHNLFTIILGLVFIVSASAFASEDVRNAVIGEEIITEQGIDNSQLLAADLDNFDLQMTITNVTEDEKKYYVTFRYRTLVIKDNIWQSVTEESTLTVYKEALGNSDLGLYVTKKLSQAADYILNFLKEVQTAEKEKGLTKFVTTVEYTGLIGLVLNVKEKVLPGYEPVITEPEPEPEPKPEIVEEITPTPPQEEVEPPIAIGSIDRESLRQMIQELLAQQQEQPIEEITTPETMIDSHPAPETTADEAYFTFGSSDPDATFQCKVNLLDWTNCTSPKTYPGLIPGDYTFQVFATDPQGKYDKTPAIFSWTIVEAEQPPAEEPVCDSEHLDLCTTQAECETVVGFWYNDTCNAESEALPCAPDWSCTEWEPVPSSISCGQTFTQTRICADLNECGTDEEKPTEEQQIVGTDATACGTISCDVSLNLIGECQNSCFEGSCQTCTPICICAEGFSDCDNDMTNGCEIASSTCPVAEPPTE